MTEETAPDAPDVPVVHEPGRSRFVVRDGGVEAELVYGIRGDVITLAHTAVPDALEGRGLGGRLVRAALAHAIGHGLQVLPTCPFARSWLERHPAETAGAEILAVESAPER